MQLVAKEQLEVKVVQGLNICTGKGRTLTHTVIYG